MECHGYCADEFAPVREAFEQNFAEGLELGASVSVTRGGEVMVDLWGGVLHGVPPGLVGAQIRVSRVTARPFSSFVICAGAIVGLLVTPSARAVAQVCGNGVIEGAEACDGLELGGQTCLTLGFDGGSLVCAGDCSFDTSGCLICGNGVIEGAEACDGLDLGGQTCATFGFDGGTLACAGDCSFDTSGCEVCGNGVSEETEVCDGVDLGGQTCLTLGFDGGPLACAVDCNSFDISGCTGTGCGDGSVEGTEDCDGLNLGGQTCLTLGFDGGSLVCAGDCNFDTSGCSGIDPIPLPTLNTPGLLLLTLLLGAAVYVRRCRIAAMRL